MARPAALMAERAKPVVEVRQPGVAEEILAGVEQSLGWPDGNPAVAAQTAAEARYAAVRPPWAASPQVAVRKPVQMEKAALEPGRWIGPAADWAQRCSQDCRRGRVPAAVCPPSETVQREAGPLPAQARGVNPLPAPSAARPDRQQETDCEEGMGRRGKSAARWRELPPPVAVRKLTAEVEVAPAQPRQALAVAQLRNQVRLSRPVLRALRVGQMPLRLEQRPARPQAAARPQAEAGRSPARAQTQWRHPAHVAVQLASARAGWAQDQERLPPLPAARLARRQATARYPGTPAAAPDAQPIAAVKSSLATMALRATARALAPVPGRPRRAAARRLRAHAAAAFARPATP